MEIVNSYNEFVVTMRDEVSMKLEGESIVETREVMKNNGTVYVGLTLGGNGEEVMPTIYLEDYYKSYQNGVPMENLVDMIISLYENNKRKVPEGIKDFLNYSSVKKNILYKLINRKRNEELLEDVPYIPYHDLAIVFYVQVTFGEDDGIGSILIHNAHMEKWGVTRETLLEDAASNCEKLLPPVVIPLGKFICDSYMKRFGALPDDMVPEELLENLPMHIVTNTRNVFGAGVILYEGILKSSADSFDKNLAILPSSVHEMIIIPVDCESECEHLLDIVREVNCTSVKEEDFLSDNVYYYNRSKREVRMIKKRNGGVPLSV